MKIWKGMILKVLSFPQSVLWALSCIFSHESQLFGYFPGAWPVIIDDFVEHMYRFGFCNFRLHTIMKILMAISLLLSSFWATISNSYCNLLGLFFISSFHLFSFHFCILLNNTCMIHLVIFIFVLISYHAVCYWFIHDPDLPE